jgi:limonene-1,2-epoxide hydrolase
MPDGLLPSSAPSGAAAAGTLTDPQAVVEAFLAALADGDTDTALALVDDDIEYVNVGLPPIRGREQMVKVAAVFERPDLDFEVYLHAISADGPTVLNERTDVLVFKGMRTQFWVAGRFDVHDGKITLWRDAFDFVDILRGVARGLVGIVLPSVRPQAPRTLDDPPGR